MLLMQIRPDVIGREPFRFHAVAGCNRGERMYGTWWKMGMDMTMLAIEAQGVIAQRMAMLALGGPNAQAEAQRMVTEKMFAAGEAAMQMATGASNATVIRGYRRKVRANARRLRKG